MCGIYCFLTCKQCKDANNGLTVPKDILDLFKRRGPNGLCELTSCVRDIWELNFAGSILWMQGAAPTLQPIVNEDGNVLLWNGDVFFNQKWQSWDSDTQTVMDHMSGELGVINTLKSVIGPYTFIFFDKKNSQLYFGRDRMGRHSLLWSFDCKGALILTSVVKRGQKNFEEVPVLGIFSIDLTSESLDVIKVYTWSDTSEEEVGLLNGRLPVAFYASSEKVPVSIEPVPRQKHLAEEHLQLLAPYRPTLFQELQMSCMRMLILELLDILKESVRVRIDKQPRLCKNCMRKVVLSTCDSGDECSAAKSSPHSRRDDQCTHSKTGILFSGGLDSTVLAAIAHLYVPFEEEIDLLNVAFEKKKQTTNKTSNKLVTDADELTFDVPDRLTAKEALYVLEQACPERKWNLVMINVSQDELHHFRKNNIADLIYPRKTILDESLGCALWFAAHGCGVVQKDDTIEPYTTPVRVLLLGMGADELFGGYRRHRNTLARHGWDKLQEELLKDLNLMPFRNLGRDDRVVSDNGVQSRLPYLDERLVSFALSLKPWEKCYPTAEYPAGTGDKLLLRLVAWRLGLVGVAQFPKRAMQFGCRIANSNERGDDVSERLKKE